MDPYRDVLAGGRPKRREYPTIDADRDLVVEEVESGFCGVVVGFEGGMVVLEDRFAKRRLFPLQPGAFLLDGVPVTLRRPAPGTTPARTERTASGSIAVGPQRARVAAASRIWVEGLHDAALVERIWGDDLRVEGVVVEPLSGVDHLPEAVREFEPGPGRRIGVLVDHLVPNSKESRIADSVSNQYVMVTGHPYVDIWQAVKPAVHRHPGLARDTRGQVWKDGVCAALGVREPAEMWRLILSRVNTFHDIETPLIGAVERLIDHVTAAD